MFTGDLFRGIFDAPVPTVMQLAVLSLVLLALFLYVVIWPKLLAYECARNLGMMREQVRRIRAIHDAKTTDPQQRAWSVWAIGQVRTFTKRHKVRLEYLGITEAELTIIAYHLAHEPDNRASAPSTAQKAFVMDEGDLCQRVDEEDLLDVELSQPPPERSRSMPPPFDPTTLPPPRPRSTAPADSAGAAAATDERAATATAGGSAKDRRSARRAAKRASRQNKK